MLLQAASGTAESAAAHVCAGAAGCHAQPA